MSLYPGAPRKKVDGQYVLDDEALKDSMAMAIEKAMEDVFMTIKKTSLPEVGKDDRRLLFVAIARGILQYLYDYQKDVLASVTIAHKTGPSVTHTVDNLHLDIKMNQ